MTYKTLRVITVPLFIVTLLLLNVGLCNAQVETLRVTRTEESNTNVSNVKPPNFWAIKTNLFYGAFTYTPNLGVEIGLSNRSTLDIGGGYNWLNRNGSEVNNKKLVHWLGQIEYRYWLCSKFSGHFFGVHALGSEYNISGHELPLLFGKGSEAYRYEGWGVGGGISYGYTFYLAKRWSLEANVGVGYARLHYKKYDCVKCGKEIGTENRNYFGPTKGGISLIYLIK